MSAWKESHGCGPLSRGCLDALLYHSNFFSLSFVRKEPELELKGQNVKTNPFDLTAYELFTLQEPSRDAQRYGFHNHEKEKGLQAGMCSGLQSSQEGDAVTDTTCQLSSINFTQCCLYFPGPSHPPRPPFSPCDTHSPLTL